MHSMPTRRGISVVLGLALIAFTSPASVFAADATLLGRVTDARGASPRAGVVVALYDAATQSAFRSEPTDARGAFRVGGAPAGTYQVVVESSEGAYLAGDSIALKAGDNKPLAVALQPAAQQGQSAPAAGQSTQAPWVKWVIAGGILLGGAFVVNAVTDDEGEASGF